MPKNPAFASWQRDDDPADGPNNEWSTSQHWGGPENGMPYEYISEQEFSLLEKERAQESEEIKFARELAAYILRAEGKLTLELLVDEIEKRHPHLSGIGTKTLLNIINEFK